MPAWFEECITTTPYSHVAMFYRDPKTKKLWIAESSGKDGLIDFFTGRDVSGPRLVDAETKVREYVPQYGWGIVFRRLRGEKIKEFRNDRLRMEVLYKWMKSQSGKQFEIHKLEMVESYLRRTFFNRSEDSCSWFCSEYVAAAWMKMGIPMNGAPADRYCPQDFTEEEEDVFDPAFHGEEGGYLEGEVLIV